MKIRADLFISCNRKIIRIFFQGLPVISRSYDESNLKVLTYVQSSGFHPSKSGCSSFSVFEISWNVCQLDLELVFLEHLSSYITVH